MQLETERSLIISRITDRILDITYKHKLAHISSCLTALPIIYDCVKNSDIFILSNGHAGLAYYCVLEEIYGHDAEQMFLDFGIHPCLDISRHVYCSTGSLGMGVTVAIGYALASKKKVSVLVSDGETFEGSFWEALNYKSNHGLDNLQIHVNMNGYSAYDTVDKALLTQKLLAFCYVHIHYTDFDIGFLSNSLAAHYYNMTEEDYEKRSNRSNP